MAVPKVLIVDDDASMRAAIERTLRSRQYETIQVVSGDAAVELVAHAPYDDLAAAILDLQMPGLDGLQTLAAIKRLRPELQVLILTGRASIAAAVQAIRRGADDFLEKPYEPAALRLRVVTAVRAWRAKCRGAKSSRHKPADTPESLLIGASPAMRQIREMVRRLADSDATVLVLGETGTGKEQFAKALHCGGERRRHPFSIVDAAALNSTVIESELFGHLKGAFTGADRDREGLIRAADAGTVFIDEIAELTLPLQAKLLRVIQERAVRPLGADQPVPIRARLIAATNQDLAEAVAGGAFRQDLFQRLNVVVVTMPPLREHKEDIVVLGGHFLAQYRHVDGESASITSDALAVLLSHDWPGNVRELENVMLRATLLGTASEIGVEDLPPYLGANPQGIADGQVSPSLTNAKVAPPGHTEAARSLEAIEEEAIVAALRQTRGNRKQAAGILRIGTATLYRKIRKYHIPD